MVILDAGRFWEALKRKGYTSASELAQNLGIHRNTIQRYLSGKNVLPENLEKVLRALSLKFSEALIEKKESASPQMETLAAVVDKLHREFPEATFILFGSRAEGRARQYSDWDIGVYSRDGIAHALYRKIALRKDDLEEGLPYFIDIVNLNRADLAFLRDISKDWVFLTGSQQDWLDLQKKVAG